MNTNKPRTGVLELWNVIQSQPSIREEQVSQIKDLHDSVINSLSNKGPWTKLKAAPQPRTRHASSHFRHPYAPSGPSISEDKIPLLHLKCKVGTSGSTVTTSLESTSTLSMKSPLLAPRSRTRTLYPPALERVQLASRSSQFLAGGAHVVITTSGYSCATVKHHQTIFQRHGSRGSALTIVPLNQTSKQEVEALTDYILHLTRHGPGSHSAFRYSLREWTQGQ